MIGLMLAVGLVLGADARLLALLAMAVFAPLPSAVLIAVHWWRARPGLSMRAASFCEAVSGELRAGATLRAALARAAASVDAVDLEEICESGVAMSEVAAAARAEFAEIGPELEALLARADGLVVSPAALFDEIAGVALAQLEVAHEVRTATAAARATGTVLVLVPTLAVAWALTRGEIEPYLRHPAQRAAVLAGTAMVIAGLASSLMILRRAR